ncbi:hypothetical protein [Clostridium sp. MD294]|uniref:hypothetical protein n=1 Tax=Clostridium sp. MD294 TaxID=97138 RepID=UPI0002CB1EDB|nr:hypothetical protein [Clostridium sp. MD294]NDO47449.1 hypothetical protein [Clostridium sp. MD294]USF29480.1 hypothetical protein C820_000871 [Clostridium sp. MD294]
MCYSERRYIHKLFKLKDYIQLYHIQTETMQKMLLIDNQEDFEDFLKYYYDIEEEVFWLYYSVVQGESLLIEGYDEDVSEKVTLFLKQKLPRNLFCNVLPYIQNLYVDLGTKNTIEKQIAICNQYLQNTEYSLQLCYDETYCAGVYFLNVSVLHNGYQ